MDIVLNYVCGRKLTFGDKEQIAELERRGFYEQKRRGDDTRKFEVVFSYSGDVNIEVDAVNEEEAKKLAEKELNVMSHWELSDCMERESVDVREL